MIRWLRRHQPRNVALAILYWVAIAAVTVALLVFLFYYVVDPLLAPLLTPSF